MGTPELTVVQLAIDSIVGNGCDCGTDEPGTCMACLCSAAIRGLVETLQSAVDDVAQRRAVLQHACVLVMPDAPCAECRWLAQAAALDIVPGSP